MSSPSKSGGHLPVMLRGAAAALLICGAAPAMSATVTLCAEPYAQDLPGAPQTPMWGYRQVTTVAECDANGGVGTASPGPLITVAAGDPTLAITLVNKLTVPTSIVIAGQNLPGDGGAPVMAADLVGPACVPTPAAAASSTDPNNPQNCRVRSFTGETAPGASRTYTFSNLRPGSYLYQSGTHPQVQIQMGLFGMVRQDATLAGSTGRLLFAAATGAYDVDVPVVLSEIDVAQHGLIAATLGGADPTSWKTGNNSTLNYAPNFFLVNGKLYDGATATDLAVAAVPGSRLVLRLANAGLQSRSLMFTSGTVKLLTEDGRPYPAPQEHATVLLPAGKTSDALLTANPPATGIDRSLGLFDRRGGADGGQIARLALSVPVGPVMQPLGNQVVNEGAAMALQVQGVNLSPGSYVLTSTSAVPAGMVISSTGLISWPVPVGTAVPTAYDLTVSAGDGTTTVSQSFNLRVNHTPTIGATGPIAVSHGTVTIAAPGVLAGASDPDTDALSAVQTAAASAGTLTLNANGSYTWSGPQPASGSSPVTFGVAARDPYGLQSASTTVTLNVAANAAPVANNDGTSLTGRQTITLAAGTLSVKAPLSITPNPLNLATQPNGNLQIPLANILANDTDADGRVTNLQVVSITRGTVSSTTGAFSAVALPTTGGTWAEASITTAPVGDGTGTIRFVPRTRTNTVAGSVVVGFPTGTLLDGGALQTSLGVYRVIYRAVDDQGLASTNTATFYVVVN